MAQADGSVVIVTKMDTSGFTKGEVNVKKAFGNMASAAGNLGNVLKNVFTEAGNNISKQEQKVESLKSKLAELSEQKIATQEYSEINKEIERLETSLDKAIEKEIKFVETDGNRESRAFKGMEYDIEKISADLEEARRKKEQLESSGSAYQDIDTSEIEQKLNSEIAKLEELKQKEAEAAAEAARLREIGENAEISDQHIVDLNNELQRLKERQADLSKAGLGLGYAEFEQNTARIAEIEQELRKYKATLTETADAERDAGNAGKEAAQKMSFIKSTLSVLAGGYKKLADYAKQAEKKIGKGLVSGLKKAAAAMLLLHKSTKKASASMGASLKTILKYGLGIRSLYVLFNKMRSAIKEGFENLAQYSDKTNASLSALKSSLTQLKNSLATAFNPILTVISPILTKFINMLSQAVTYVGMFFAALTGQKSFTKAVAVQEKFAESLEDTAENAKEAKKYLSGLDEVRTFTEDKGTSSKNDLGGISPPDMFEEVEIPQKILEMADKVKDILSKLFEPLKKAWEQEGQFVMDAWRYALDETWKLIKDIGRDFLTVWQEDETVAILANILHIIGDIGLVIGHLARNFREAWNENQVGLEILRNIRDVIGTIVRHIRNMADATVEWADKLNFYPILDAFERFLDSIKPVVDAIWGIIEDFYTKVLLPLSKWTLEKGLPELLQVFIDFNNKVDWAALRANLAEFWEHLEPFAETVGEGLILFIQKVSDALAGFINSDAFKDFLKTVEDWMDSITAEDVANTLIKVAEALVALKVAVLGFSVIKGITEVTTVLKSFFGLFSGLIGVLPNVISLIGGLGQSVVGLLGTISAPMAAIIAAVAALAAGMIYVLKTNDEVRQGLIDAIQNVWSALKNIWENVLVPLGSLIADVLKPIIDMVIDVLKQLWQNVIVPLAEVILNVLIKALNGFADIINNTVVPILNTMIEVLKFLWNTVLEPLIDFLNSTLSPVFESVFGTIKALIEDLGEVLSGLIDFIVGVFTGDWKRAWDGIKQIFKGVWDGLKDIVNGALDAIKNAVKTAFDWIAEKIGSIKEKISGIGSSISSALGKSTYSISISDFQVPVMPIPQIATAHIPYLASGAVIPPNAPFLAVLGDQKSGTNVEAPLSAIEDTVNKAVRNAMGNQQRGGTYIFNAQMNRRTIFSEMIEEAQLQQMLTGRNPFELA